MSDVYRVTFENKEGVRYSYLLDPPVDRSGEWETPCPEKGYGSQAGDFLEQLTQSDNCPEVFLSSPPVICRIEKSVKPATRKDGYKPRPGVYSQGNRICIEADGEEASGRAALRLEGARACWLLNDILSHLGMFHSGYEVWAAHLGHQVLLLGEQLRKEKSGEGMIGENAFGDPEREPDESITCQDVITAFATLQEQVKKFTSSCTCTCGCDTSPKRRPLSFCHDCLFGDDDEHQRRNLTEDERQVLSILCMLGR